MSGSRAASAAILFGTLGILAIPAGVAAAWLSDSIALLQATEVAVAAGFILGCLALAFARRARLRVAQSVWRQAEVLAGTARFLAWASVYLAVSGAIALGFYGLLVLRS